MTSEHPTPVHALLGWYESLPDRFQYELAQWGKAVFAIDDLEQAGARNRLRTRATASRMEAVGLSILLRELAETALSKFRSGPEAVQRERSQRAQVLRSNQEIRDRLGPENADRMAMSLDKMNSDPFDDQYNHNVWREWDQERARYSNEALIDWCFRGPPSDGGSSTAI